MPGMVLYGLLFPSLGIHLFTDRTNPGSSSSTLTQRPLVCGVIFIFIWLILVLYLSLLCHLTHSYLLSPHLIFCDSELSYSFYFYLPLCLLLGYGLCTGPALNMYVYNVWCLLLAFPRLDINLDSSTTCLLYSNLKVVLVDNSFHPISISCSCVCLWHLGENRHTGFRPPFLSLRTECSWHLGENRFGTKET